MWCVGIPIFCTAARQLLIFQTTFAFPADQRPVSLWVLPNIIYSEEEGQLKMALEDPDISMFTSEEEGSESQEELGSSPIPSSSQQPAAAGAGAEAAAAAAAASAQLHQNISPRRPILTLFYSTVVWVDSAVVGVLLSSSSSSSKGSSCSAQLRQNISLRRPSLKLNCSTVVWVV